MPIMPVKHLSLLKLLTGVVLIASCTSPPSSVVPAAKVSASSKKGFKVQSVHAQEPEDALLEIVTETPSGAGYELRFQTGSLVPGSVRIPSDGAFKVSIESGSSYALLDADATDAEHLIRIQVPESAFDLYMRAEEATAASALCQTGSGSSMSTLDQMDQLVLNKINSLIAQGKSQCTYLPPTGQRQNANCNSSSSGFQCSGSLNKTITAASCPEIAIYTGAMNLNNAQPNSKLFVATQNNLTLNQSAKGVLTTRGNLNTSLNGSSLLEGVFVGGSSNNLNLSGSASVRGLYTLANSSSLGANFNNNSTFEGVLCATGSFNVNRGNTSQTHYHPDILSSWVSDVPNLPNLLCPARNNFYNQNTPLTCSPATSTASLFVNDNLYGINQTLTANSDGRWYRATGRPAPVPVDWANADGQKYVLNFENHGTAAFTMRLFSQTSPPQVPASVNVIPAVDCIKPNGTGGHTAYLSYTNLMPNSVSLTPGERNQVVPVSNQGVVPSVFAPGQSELYPNSSISVDFIGNTLTWILGARSVTVNAADPVLKCPEILQNADLLITDVTLIDNGMSIMGKNAPGSIVPDYAGSYISLNLTGTFKNSQNQPLTLDDFLFTLAYPLKQQTFIGTEPQARVLLDDSILLDTWAVSETEIQAGFNTDQIPDLYLKGLHKLSVQQGDWYTDVLIQVGEPMMPQKTLSPHIDSVEVMRDAQNRPLHIRLTGDNFMLYPKFSYTTIDGEFGFGFQTELSWEEQSKTIVHIPHPETFDSNPQHIVVMATPFGVAIKEF